MNAEEINVAIAEHLGWADIENHGGRRPWGYPPIPHTPVQRVYVPDFCNDLNAMRSALASLPDDKWEDFDFWFMQEIEWRPNSVEHCRNAYLATADQYARAFLRTVGEWKEGA